MRLIFIIAWHLVAWLRTFDASRPPRFALGSRSCRPEAPSAGVTYPTGLHLELGGVLGVDFSDHTGAVGLGLAGSLGTHGTILTGGLGISQRFMFPIINALIGPSYLKRYGEGGGYVGGRLSLLLLFFGFDVGVFYPTDDHSSKGRLINLGFKVGF